VWLILRGPGVLAGEAFPILERQLFRQLEKSNI
jgi:hypothetical protein